MQIQILRVKFDNIGLFQDGLCVDFTAKDRVADPSHVNRLTGSVYSQKIISFVGINASGKSMALKLIKFAMDVLLGHKSLDQLSISSGIIKDNSIMTIDFFNNEKFYRVESKIGEIKSDIEDDIRLIFADETIYSKNKSAVKSKDKLFEYSIKDIIYTRKMFEAQKFSILKPQDSIVIAITKDVNTYYTDMIQETNINLYRVKGDAQMEFINLFDDSIKSLNVSDDNLEVCFKTTSTPYECNSPLNGHELLSSGTIKGGNLMYKTSLALKAGGYLLVDEIEIHMHKELVLTIIDFFNDEEINKHGAVLVFTTHYAEILDSIDRKDNIYIMKKRDNYSCEAVRYSDEIERNDIKKSEIFLSNFIGGTAPSYENIEKVRKFLCRD